jgi:hypothetical protein
MNNKQLNDAYKDFVGQMRYFNIKESVFKKYWPWYKNFTPEQCTRNGHKLLPVRALEFDYIFNQLKNKPISKPTQMAAPVQSSGKQRRYRKK